MTRLHWLAIVAIAGAGAFPAASFAQGFTAQPSQAEVSVRGFDNATPPPVTPRDPAAAAAAAPASDVRPEIAKPLHEASVLNEAKDYAGALAKVREADAVTGKTPHEEYLVSRYMGSIALKLNDRATAFAAFSRAVASNAIPADGKATILYIVMALSADRKDFAAAVSYGEMLRALGPLEEKASVILAQAYYNKGDRPGAVRIASAALAQGVTDPQNKAALVEIETKGQPQNGQH